MSIKTCDEDGCSSPFYARNKCNKHYKRLRYRELHPDMKKPEEGTLPKWNLHDVTWLAGIIEGEGYIGPRRKGLTIVVSMTDEDVIHKIHSLFGVGTLTGPYYRTGKLGIYNWSVHRREHVTKILKAIYPFMGVRRANKIEELLLIK